MEIVIIIGAIGSVIAYVCLSTKTEGELAQKRNPCFKSSLRHNSEHQNSEDVFKVLKEANISPCFLDLELNKQNNRILTDSTLIQSHISNIRDDSSILFNPQSKDNSSPLKIVKADIRKDISIEPQKDGFDNINPDLFSQLIEIDQFEQRQEQSGPVKKLTPPKK